MPLWRGETECALTINVHGSFPLFIRIAYDWLLIAAVLTVWASLAGEAAGIWGASRLRVFRHWKQCFSYTAQPIRGWCGECDLFVGNSRSGVGRETPPCRQRG